jgi:hypothetical protein
MPSLSSRFSMRYLFNLSHPFSLTVSFHFWPGSPKTYRGIFSYTDSPLFESYLPL